MIRKICFPVIIISLFACNNPDRDYVSNKDSIEIFVSVLNSKSFVKGNILYGDSLHFIKSKHYNKDFPVKSTYFKLFYIENSDENRQMNFPGRHTERRNIYEITRFKIESDSAQINLYNPQGKETYIYKLAKVQNLWVIKKEEGLID